MGTCSNQQQCWSEKNLKENEKQDSYAYPAEVLRYVRALLPDDITGEFRTQGVYNLSLAEFAGNIF